MIAAAAWDASIVIGMLVLVAGLVALNLLVGVVLWWRHSGLADRVTKLEVQHAHHLTHKETGELFDRIARLEGMAAATNRMLETVQEHLMEKD
ncbi:hypothetical protein [Stenotrophomonas sp. PSU-St15]